MKRGQKRLADIEYVNEKTIRIAVSVADSVRMVKEASQHIPLYAKDIVTICEKMPAFDYTSFCFYAYDSAQLFEWMLGMNPRNYTSFSLNAPDGFFYTLYGGMNALYDAAQHALTKQPAV